MDFLKNYIMLIVLAVLGLLTYCWFKQQEDFGVHRRHYRGRHYRGMHHRGMHHRRMHPYYYYSNNRPWLWYDYLAPWSWYYYWRRPYD